MTSETMNKVCSNIEQKGVAQLLQIAGWGAVEISNVGGCSQEFQCIQCRWGQIIKSAQKFMQVELDVNCMETNFGGCVLFIFWRYCYFQCYNTCSHWLYWGCGLAKQVLPLFVASILFILFCFEIFIYLFLLGYN